MSIDNSFSIKNDTVVGYKGTETDVIIPDGVKKIGDSAFKDCKSIETITLPDSVTSIGECAFAGCTSLISAPIPDSVTKMGDATFSGCWRLLECSIPDGVKKIGEYTFWACCDLNSVVIPDSVTTIEDSAFSGCDSLESIIMPKGLKNVGDNIFPDDTLVIFEKYSDGIKNKSRSFSKRLVFKTTPIQTIKSTIVKDYAVRGFLTTEDLAIYDDEVVESYKKYLKGKIIKYVDLIMENDTEQIVNRLAALDLLDTKFVNTLLKNELTVAAKAVLLDYTNAHATTNEEFSFEKKRPSVTELKKSWGFEKNEDGITITSYKGLETEVVVPDIIGKDTVTEIGAGAFSRRVRKISRSQAEIRQKITSITLPKTIRIIGDGAFSDCNSLTTIVIPNNVTSIPIGLFENCDHLTSITIPNGVTIIESRAFCKCNGLKSIIIPSSVKEIGDSAFSDCSNLDVNYSGSLSDYLNIHFKSLFGNSVGWSNMSLSVDGTLLTDVVIPDNITNIGGYAFYGCSSLKSVTISSGIKKIGNSAFQGCTNLASVVIPESVTSIGERAFAGCDNLVKLNIPDSVNKIESFAFTGCDNLKDVLLPANITDIVECTFHHCHGLTSITIPDSVTNIGGTAFGWCQSLEKIMIPKSVTNIAWNAFAGCNNLTIYAPSGSYAEQFAKENEIGIKVLDK